MSLTSPCMSITLIVSCSLFWFKANNCMAPQHSVQLKQCAAQCNNHWCHCNKLIMLLSKVLQRQAVIPFILTKAFWHKIFCFHCMHQATAATAYCSVAQAHTPAIVESKPLHNSVFPFLHSMAKPPRFMLVVCWHGTNVKHLLFLPTTHDTFFPKVKQQ